MTEPFGLKCLEGHGVPCLCVCVIEIPEIFLCCLAVVLLTAAISSTLPNQWGPMTVKGRWVAKRRRRRVGWKVKARMEEKSSAQKRLLLMVARSGTVVSARKRTFGQGRSVVGARLLHCLNSGRSTNSRICLRISLPNRSIKTCRNYRRSCRACNTKGCNARRTLAVGL